MIIDIINKVLIVLFCFASINTLRHIYYFIQAWISSNNDETVRYKLEPTQLFFLGLSISYIITGIITGIFI
jgi:hypothetical protein